MKSQHSQMTGKNRSIEFQQIQDGDWVSMKTDCATWIQANVYRISADELLISPFTEKPVEIANIRTVFPLKSFKGYKFKPGMRILIKTKDDHIYPAEIALILKDGLYIRPPGSQKKPSLIDLFRLWILKK